MDYKLVYRDDITDEEKEILIEDVTSYEYNTNGCVNGDTIKYRNIKFFDSEDDILLEIFNIHVIRIQAY